MAYDHQKIENKWQERWDKAELAKASEDPNKKKYYTLVEFPYPSGAGLHTGHVRSYTAMDVVSRKRRAEGFSVLFPIGWDAFGLPTENYAIKTGRNPADITKENTDTFRRQLKSLGLSFDWSREINTTDPAYYKWTQWIFLQFLKHDLAYKTKTLINWCPKDKIGLANEEVVDGKCERCGTVVEKREKEQWMLAITKYAQRLYDDLDTVDYIERAKIQQRNWIGPSEGAEIDFELRFTHDDSANQNRGPNGEKAKIAVFTTRPDTLFGATFLVLSPEHLWVTLATNDDHHVLANKDAVKKYASDARKKTDIERGAENKVKTGVKIEGVVAVNPATKEEIPIFVADYVLSGYGTGALMAVPAHDERDFAFAQKFDIPMRRVILNKDQIVLYKDQEVPVKEFLREKGEALLETVLPLTASTTGPGVLVNSKEFNWKNSEDAKREITEFVGGKWKTTYKLRDWVFSRQRYWGEPIPVVHCDTCGIVPLPEDQLPLVLPVVENYQPTDNGDSPLAAITEWVNTTCPKCGGEAKRETDTMPNWAGSSWYYLRYADPHNDAAFASPEALKYWTPVDWYNGGMEHTVLHLLYSRFWHKFLFDIGLVPTHEPYQKRTSHGLILAEGGEKMSKSKGNTVSPDEIVERFGADALRVYEMFMGPFEQSIAWSTDNLVGALRFLERVERASLHMEDVPLSKDTERIMHQTIKKVGDDIEELKMNTAISSLMIFLNALEKEKTIPIQGFRILIRLLAPFAPHLAEELWEKCGGDFSVHQASWPTYDASKLEADTVTIAIQINGKVRGEITMPRGSEEFMVIEAAEAIPKIANGIAGKSVKKRVYVPDRLLNIVV
jgi:leucyl-tRNA synthetase